MTWEEKISELSCLCIFFVDNLMCYSHLFRRVLCLNDSNDAFVSWAHCLCKCMVFLDVAALLHGGVASHFHTIFIEKIKCAFLMQSS